MAEYTPSELLALVNASQINAGDERVRAITARIVTDLFRTIEAFAVTPDEFWSA